MYFDRREPQSVVMHGKDTDGIRLLSNVDLFWYIYLALVGKRCHLDVCVLFSCVYIYIVVLIFAYKHHFVNVHEWRAYHFDVGPFCLVVEPQVFVVIELIV